MKIWWSGSRDFEKSVSIEQIVNAHFLTSTENRTGGARGIDTLVENYILEFIYMAWNNYDGILPKILPSLKAEWKKYGKGAGFIRNKEGVDWCDEVVAIWDGKSRGTKHCYDYAYKQGKIVHLYTLMDGHHFNIPIFRYQKLKLVSEKEEKQTKWKAQKGRKKGKIDSWARSAKKSQKKRRKKK